MSKAFLCHSSIQKDIVRKVATNLNRQEYEFDEVTFDVGQDVNSEIENKIKESDIVVLFISHTSLNSPWVQKEMKLAEDKYHRLGRYTTLAFLVDKSIDHTDKRIPEWLRKNLNLQLVLNPVVISLKIKHALRASIAQDNNIFRKFNGPLIGRFEEKNQFDTIYYSSKKNKNQSLLISGFEGTGRKFFILDSLKRVNIVRASTSEMVLFTLNSQNSIEDFLVQLELIVNDFNSEEFANILNLSIEEKIEHAILRINEYIRYNEVVCIIDKGCIIKPSHKISDWFKKLIDSSKLNKAYGLNVVSLFKPNNLENWPPLLKHIHLEELSKQDQKNLFNYFISDSDTSLSDTDLEFIYKKLKGFPKQIKVVYDLLIEHGIYTLKNNSKYIESYSDKRIFPIVEPFLNDPDTKNLLILLSQLDCVSEQMLYKLFRNTDKLRIGLMKLQNGSTIERTGIEGELIKVPESISDYIKRNKYQLDNIYSQNIRKHFKDSILNEGEINASDSIELLTTIKQVIKDGEKLSSKYYIPSFVLQAIIDLYNAKKHTSVVNLAEVVIERNTHDLDIEYQIRYYFCMALAYITKGYGEKFDKNIKLLRKPEEHFVRGFAYRLDKKDRLSELEMRKSLELRPKFSRAKRELVTVLLGQDKSEEAYSYAKANYEEEMNNPYQIHAYFQCLIRDKNPNKNIAIIKRLLDEIKTSFTNNSDLFYNSMYGEYLWIIEHKTGDAIKVLKNAISQGDRVYAPRTLHRLATKSNQPDLADSVAHYFEQEDLD